ncbi:hypothetical protein ACMDCT_11405 [Halomonadaceae bacterium KBTZ08]
MQPYLASTQYIDKAGVAAGFHPPVERLAYPVTSDGEADLPAIWAEPVTAVLEVLLSHRTYQEVADHLPDVQLIETQGAMHPA